MGRDATVWRIPFDNIPEGADLDEYELHHVRIGNLGMVMHLREIIGTLPDAQDRFVILLHQVLHHGTLSGDTIERQQVEALSLEVASLPDGHDADLDDFKTRFGELCQVAINHGSNIDF